MGLIKEAARMYARRRHISRHGFPAYAGDAEAICRQIVDRCYDPEEKYYRTSAGHFQEFYTRDFGLCVEALLRLGKKEEVHRTLQYALSVFSRHGKITTQISPDGLPIDTFSQSSDALPFLLRSLRIAKADDLVEVYRPFLEGQAIRYEETVTDGTGLVRRKRYFSSIKDAYRRDSSCYDNCCVQVLKDEFRRLDLRSPFGHNHDARQSAEHIKRHFWNGSYFTDDMSKKDYVAGDANTFPYYFGIIKDEGKDNGKDKGMISSSIAAIRSTGLDLPFPLKYTNFRDRKKEMLGVRLFAPNYEGDTVWRHLGLAYMQVVAGHDKRLLNKYLDAMEDHIMEHKNFLEVFRPDGTPYRSAFYICDDSMLWAANYLSLKMSLD